MKRMSDMQAHVIMNLKNKSSASALKLSGFETTYPYTVKKRIYFFFVKEEHIIYQN